MEKVHVEIWSDFVCPWCWIAKRRFESAVNALSGQVEVITTTRSYRLAKGMTPSDFKTTLRNKFGSKESADRMMSAVEQAGSSEGLVYNFDSMLFGDTSDAHVLIKSIQSSEVAAKVYERLLKAATTDGIDIFNRETLLMLAKEIGIDDKEVDFDSPKIHLDISQDEKQANLIANGVPLFLFNGKTYLSGAQEFSVFIKTLLDSATEMTTASDAAAGASCGINGCAN